MILLMRWNNLFGTKVLVLFPLLGHTDSSTLTASCLGVLTTHTQTPEVTQTTVAPHPLQALNIFSQFLI